MTGETYAQKEKFETQEGEDGAWCTGAMGRRRRADWWTGLKAKAERFFYEARDKSEDGREEVARHGFPC